MFKNYLKEIVLRNKQPFYSRYKPKYLFNAIDARVAISHKSQFVYFRIPKAANSTIVMTLYAYEHNMLTRDFESRSVKNNYFSRPSSLSHKEFKKLEESYFKFTFVRNPYTRLASAYLDKIINNKSAKKCVADSLNRPLEAVISFREFCNFLENGGLRMNVHWIPQSELIVMPKDALDFIGKIENLDNDIQHVIERIFHPEPSKVKVFNWSPHKTNASRKYKDLYDDYSRRVVCELYEDDFKNFGYDMSQLV